MKKLGIVLLLLASTSAFAFGGGGGGQGRTHKWYRHGVDSIGVHIGGDGGADIITCKDDEELIDGKCLKKCGEGLERNTDNTCTVCTNGNVYLSYNADPCGTTTPMNEAATGCECTNADGKCVSFEYDSGWNMICAASDATPCKSNKDCASTEYCALTNSQWACNQPDVGTCMPLTDGVSYTYNNKTFLRSDNNMTWWSAENWCKAKGKQLVSLASTGINKDNLGDYFNNNGWCCDDCGGDEYKCENVNWDALRTVFESDAYWWTRDNYDSCDTFSVALYFGGVSYNYRDYYDFFALCE